MDKLDHEVNEAMKQVGRSLLGFAYQTWKPVHEPHLVRLLMAEVALYVFIGALTAFTKPFVPSKQAEVWGTFQERADELYERMTGGDCEPLRLFDA